MFFEFPTEHDWIKIGKGYPFHKLDIRDDEFRSIAESGTGIEGLCDWQDIQTWMSHLTNRLGNLRHSYIFSMFYFLKGIPDDEWMISPGPSGESTKYFPHFETFHRFRKYQFDYYADVFFFKCASSWESIWQILNVAYTLGFEQKAVSRQPVLKGLGDRNPALAADLKKVANQEGFLVATEMRNAIAHRFLPHSVDSGVERKDLSIEVSAGRYTTSRETAEAMRKSLDTLSEGLSAIRARTKSIKHAAPHLQS